MIAGRVRLSAHICMPGARLRLFCSSVSFAWIQQKIKQHNRKSVPLCRQLSEIISFFAELMRQSWMNIVYIIEVKYFWRTINIIHGINLERERKNRFVCAFDEPNFWRSNMCHFFIIKTYEMEFRDHIWRQHSSKHLNLQPKYDPNVCARTTTKHPSSWWHLVIGVAYRMVSLQFLLLFSFALFMFSMTNDMNYFLGGNTPTVTHSITKKNVYTCKIIRIWFGFFSIAVSASQG